MTIEPPAGIRMVTTLMNDPAIRPRRKQNATAMGVMGDAPDLKRRGRSEDTPHDLGIGGRAGRSPPFRGELRVSDYGTGGKPLVT